MNGKWFYLYRAIDKYGDTLDVYFSPKRNRYAAYDFLKRVLKPYRSERQPKTGQVSNMLICIFMNEFF